MKIVITGASRGFGKSIAEKFAADGKDHIFFLSARNAESLQQTTLELQERFSSARFMAQAADLAEKEEIKKLADWILKQGVPDVLVNNAGIFLPGNVHDEKE